MKTPNLNILLIFATILLLIFLIGCEQPISDLNAWYRGEVLPAFGAVAEEEEETATVTITISWPDEEEVK